MRKFGRYLLVMRETEGKQEAQLMKDCGKIYVYWSSLDEVLAYASSKLKLPSDLTEWSTHV